MARRRGACVVAVLGAGAIASCTPIDGLADDGAYRFVSPPTVCAGESDQAFCARLGGICGPTSGIDVCGVQRTVPACGICPDIADTCVDNACVPRTMCGRYRFVEKPDPARDQFARDPDCRGCGIVHDTVTKLDWQLAPIANVTYEEAVAYCTSRGGAWRLAREAEVRSIGGCQPHFRELVFSTWLFAEPADDGLAPLAAPGDRASDGVPQVEKMPRGFQGFVQCVR